MRRSTGMRALGVWLLVAVVAGVSAGAVALSLSVVQEYNFYVTSGDSAWVYKADYSDAGNSGWSGPHVINFYVGVLHYQTHWIGLFAYEANAGTYEETLYIYRE